MGERVSALKFCILVHLHLAAIKKQMKSRCWEHQIVSVLGALVCLSLNHPVSKSCSCFSWFSGEHSPTLIPSRQKQTVGNSTTSTYLEVHIPINMTKTNWTLCSCFDEFLKDKAFFKMLKGSLLKGTSSLCSGNTARGFLQCKWLIPRFTFSSRNFRSAWCFTSLAVKTKTCSYPRVKENHKKTLNYIHLISSLLNTRAVNTNKSSGIWQCQSKIQLQESVSSSGILCGLGSWRVYMNNLHVQSHTYWPDS